MSTKEHIAFYLDEELRLRIDLVIKRLHFSVNQIDIINWLGNFRRDELEDAVRILENLEYVSEFELINHFEERIKILISKYGTDRAFIIHPIGDYGKSGTMISYYLKKAPSFKKIEANVSFYAKSSEFKYKKKANAINKNTVLILLDDFLGSGRSLYNYYKTFIQPQLEKIPEITDQCMMSIYNLDKAKNFIEGLLPKLYLISNLKYQCFKNGRSPFGSYNNIQHFREFAHKYGEDLFTIENEGGLEKHPLGYKNSQALIIFPYNPPNNTLPIIWSSKFVVRLNRNWVPLYPRNQLFKISKAKSIRNELAFELGLLKLSGPVIMDLFYSGKGKLEWKSYSYITSTDFRLFAYMRLKQQGRSDQVICEILGLSLADLDAIHQKGVAKELFEAADEWFLTDFGKEVYADCLRNLRQLKVESGRGAINNKLKEINYIPKKFNGKAR